MVRVGELEKPYKVVFSLTGNHCEPLLPMHLSCHVSVGGLKKYPKTFPATIICNLPSSILSSLQQARHRSTLMLEGDVPATVRTCVCVESDGVIPSETSVAECL